MFKNTKELKELRAASERQQELLMAILALLSEDLERATGDRSAALKAIQKYRGII